MPLSFASEQSIWLIDDHPPLHHLVRAALEDLNFAGDLVSIYTLSEAEKQFRETMMDTRLPHLVLLDINLKGQDGLVFLKKMKGQYGSFPFPVVIFSSSDRMEEMVLAYEMGAQSYVVKPFHFDMMVQYLEGMIAFFLGQDYTQPAV
ncbi:MAG: response regulator [Bacteroidota bacterium]